MKRNKANWQPDFIGIGDQKAATTWIFNCLKEHPEICVSSIKEVKFFDKPYNYRKGLNYYRSFFDHCGEEKIKGEFTPGYIFVPEAARRIHKHYPEVKLIVCLRSPVERTFSQYRFGVQNKSKFSTYKDFKEALKKDDEILERGFYFKHLKRFFDLFPAKNILIIIYEELKLHPLQNIQKIYSFLGVRSDYYPQNVHKKKNVTGSKEVELNHPFLHKVLYRGRRIVKKDGLADKFLDKTGIKEILNKVVKKNRKIIKKDSSACQLFELSDEDRRLLFDIYKEDIEKLENLIEKDLCFWKEKNKK